MFYNGSRGADGTPLFFFLFPFNDATFISTNSVLSSRLHTFRNL